MSRIYIDALEEIEQFPTYPYDSDVVVSLGMLRELLALKVRVGAATAEPIAWESTTPFFTQFVSDRRYRLFSHKVQACYRPFRCSNCSAAPESLVRLGQRDLTRGTGNVDERVPVIAPGALKEDPVAIDIGLDRLKHDSKTATFACPHEDAPVEASIVRR